MDSSDFENDVSGKPDTCMRPDQMFLDPEDGISEFYDAKTFDAFSAEDMLQRVWKLILEAGKDFARDYECVSDSDGKRYTYDVMLRPPSTDIRLKILQRFQARGLGLLKRRSMAAHDLEKSIKPPTPKSVTLPERRQRPRAVSHENMSLKTEGRRDSIDLADLDSAMLNAVGASTSGIESSLSQPAPPQRRQRSVSHDDVMAGYIRAGAKTNRDFDFEDAANVIEAIHRCISKDSKILYDYRAQGGEEGSGLERTALAKAERMLQMALQTPESFYKMLWEERYVEGADEVVGL